MFEKFVDYMFYLLFAPLKKVIKKNNQFYIFLKVIGKLFDQTKQDLFRVREESMIISASELMLGEHGRERDMPRLKGEEVESYRMRLMMKNVIAEQAGTREGILLALRSMGYDQSFIEPYYLLDPERWAEFIIYLGSQSPSGINDISVIDKEVMKVKPARSLPSYGIQEGSLIQVNSAFRSGYSEFPRCNTIICGTWSSESNLGQLFASVRADQSGFKVSETYYPLTGTILASEKFYQERDESE
ncbi:hypothetical protein V3851_07535 [Paenibacillus sp. M1]|uniref:Uncharacterized protein n=1 Tax=Paenibacillus haidiansis TaxID=1574488 RepID=A0ABU7VPM4_9BACL